MREARRNGRLWRRWLAAAVAGLLLGGLVVPAGSGAVAAPGNPGVPGPAQEVYREGFENATGATAIRLPAYVGAEGERYTSDPFWVMQDQCNGVVLRYDGTVYPAGYCTTGNGAQNNVRRMADVLGQVEAGVVGSTNPAAPVEASTPQTRANHAVTAWTGNVNGPSNAITLETPQFDLAGQGARFFTASVNVAELSCTFQGGANNSRLTFALVSGGQELMLTNTPIRACTDTQVRYYTSPTLPGGWGNGGAYVAAGRFFADSSYLVDPDVAPTMSLRMRNLTGSSSGNDFAYDEVRLFDATPQLDKSFSPSSVPVNGRSTLTFTVTNTDDLAEKRGWGFVDTLPAGLVVADPANIGGSCSASTTAAPGSGVITIEDGVLAADEASCTVTVEVTSPAPGPSEDSPVVYANCPANVQTFGLDAPACATVEFFTEPHLSLAKQHDGTGASRPGDTVRYTVTATNDGTGDYTAADPAVVVDDLTGVLDDAAFVDGSLRAEIGGVPVGPPARSGDRIAWQGPLRVGQTVTISYEVVLGSGGDHRVRNVAFPSETPFDPDAPPPTPECGEAGSVCTELLLPAIRLEKSTQETSMSWGGRLHYVFTVTNTGQVPLDEIRIDETAFDGSGEMSAIVCDATSLQPGASTSCRATYTVTGADMDRGSLDNAATATGTPPAGDPVVSAPDDHRLTGERTPKLTIEKFSNATALVAGERISFWFVVRNEGNVTIRDLVVTEERFTGSGAPPEISCPGDELAAFTQMTCRASYLVTQEDVDRGELVNTASVTGTDPEGEPVDGGESTVDVPTQPAPGLQIRKTTATQTLIAGEDITYWFQVRNTGNMTLDEITVVETEFSGSGTLSAITCQRTTLPPQDTTWCRADYTVTQADVDAGFIENAATATGVTRDGADVTANESEQRIPSQQAPALTLEKTADAAELVVGETVTYTFRVTNTGNVTVGNVRIEEISFDGNGALGAIECPADRPLAPTESLNCTAEYEVVQADLDQGGVRNTAVAEGTRPGGETVASAPDDATVPGGGAPALTIEKTADPARMTAGGLITYTFLIRNSGNVTVTDVSVVEGGFTGSGALGAISCPDDARRLAPGESVRCTAAYRATQADVDRGSIDNSATASGTAPGGAAVESAPDDARVTAEPAPALRLVKSADTDTLVAGETVIYTFVVTNTGNVTLTGVLITEDEWTGDGDAPEVVCPADQAASLAPGAELRCTAEYL
ncbi:DUF7507 domain-containing protein, partial [Agromyces mediolanus]|uniref:DUF7507 domain-containing protein n=1 Tax=Agromyces mediolanus TaxID=41986 RepID=UPI001E440128|nr:DUF11 domain-containing protein [Agromyces mediolanus]